MRVDFNEDGDEQNWSERVAVISGSAPARRVRGELIVIQGCPSLSQDPLTRLVPRIVWEDFC